MDRRSFLKIAAGTAATIGLPCESFSATGDDDLLLDMAEAVRFSEMIPYMKDPGGCNCDCDLSAYRRATPDALEYLANQGYDGFVHIGLAELDKSNAMALARWNAISWGSAAFLFLNLEYLDEEVAAILSDTGGILHFERTMVVTPKVASLLAKSSGFLNLSMDNIPLEVANELVKHSNELDLRTRMQPSEQVLQVLCDYAGNSLSVGGWKYIGGNSIHSFKSSNANKSVSFRRYNYNHEWFESMWIRSVSGNVTTS